MAFGVQEACFVPFSTKVQLPPDSALKVEAELSRRGSSAWYQRWYVLAGFGLVAAGVTGGAIYYATQNTGNSVEVGGVIK